MSLEVYNTLSPMLLEPDERLGRETITAMLEQRAYTSATIFVEQTLPFIEAQYGQDSFEYAAAKIFFMLKPMVDAVFIEQYRLGPPPAPQSWQDVAPETVAMLQEVGNTILEGDYFHPLFAAHPAYRDIVRIFCHEVPIARDKETFKALSIQFEAFAQQLFAARMPVLVPLLDELVVTTPGDERDYMDQMEADLRLLLSPSEVERNDFETLIEASWAHGQALPFTKATFSSPPTAIWGTAVGVAGSQLYETNAGQAFYGNQYYMAPNFYKNPPMIATVSDHTGHSVDPLIARRITDLLFMLHESNHVWMQTLENSLDEVTSDVPTALTFLMMVADGTLASFDITETDALHVILAEYAYYALRNHSELPLNEGYRLSGRIIVDYLVRFGLVAFGEDGSITFTWDSALADKLMEILIIDYQVFQNCDFEITARYKSGAIAKETEYLLSRLRE